MSECQGSSEKERERERERELRREQRSWCGSNNRGGCTCGVRALDAFIQRVFCYFCRSFVIAETGTASAGGGCSGGRTMPPSRSQLLKCSICGTLAGGWGTRDRGTWHANLQNLKLWTRKLKIHMSTNKPCTLAHTHTHHRERERHTHAEVSCWCVTHTHMADK